MITEVQSAAEAVDIGRMFLAESGLPMQLSERSEAVWDELMASGKGAIFVARANGPGTKIVGALGALIHPDIIDGELTATEFFWFVDPAWRSLGVGKALLSKFEAWGQSRLAERFIVSRLLAVESASVEKLYHQFGYLPLETHYIKEIPRCQ